ncbi:MAG: YdcF family protein [Lachnospiraceae bacterium]|nr:YdcF family protein [Lachnospiraceae bacterium]
MLKIFRKHRLILTIIFLLLLYMAGNILGICLYSKKDERCYADTAIVLGAATSRGSVSPVYRERLNHGIYLYQQGYVKKIIVTGGQAGENPQSDAWAAKQYVLSQGIPEQDILIEEKSTITQENLANAKEIMDDEHFQTAIIISDPLHMKRAMLLAKDMRIVAYSSPTPTTRYCSLRTKIPFLARELFYYIGYQWYRIFHVIGTAIY